MAKRTKLIRVSEDFARFLKRKAEEEKKSIVKITEEFFDISKLDFVSLKPKRKKDL